MVRTIYKIGAIAGALLPGPLDALMLMVECAEAWAEAKETVLRRSFRRGFELGLARALAYSCDECGIFAGIEWTRPNAPSPSHCPAAQ